METPDPAEAFRAAFDARMSNVHVAGFGKVTSYNAAERTANVKVGWKRAVPTDVEGEFRTEEIPELPALPVIHFGGAQGHLRIPLSAGDTVLILVCDTDQSTWLRTGETSDPGDLRRFHLSHACCIPWAKAVGPSARDLKVASAEVGGSTDAAALASVVDAILSAVATCTPGPQEPGLSAIKTALAAYTASGSAVLKLGS